MGGYQLTALSLTVDCQLNARQAEMSELKSGLASAFGSFDGEDEEEAVTGAAAGGEAEDDEGGNKKKRNPLDALKQKLADLEQANADLRDEVSCSTTRVVNQWRIESQLAVE